MGTVRSTWDSPSAPSTRFRLEADLLSQSVSGNTSTVRMYLECINLGNTSSEFTGYGSQVAMARNLAGTAVEAGRKDGTPFLPSGVGTGVQRWYVGPFDITVTHDANGNAPINVGGGQYAINVLQAIAYGSIDEAPSYNLVVPSIPRGGKVRVSGAFKQGIWKVRVGGAWVTALVKTRQGGTWKSGI